MVKDHHSYEHTISRHVSSWLNDHAMTTLLWTIFRPLQGVQDSSSKVARLEGVHCIWVGKGS